MKPPPDMHLTYETNVISGTETTMTGTEIENVIENVIETIGTEIVVMTTITTESLLIVIPATGIRETYETRETPIIVIERGIIGTHGTEMHAIQGIFEIRATFETSAVTIETCAILGISATTEIETGESLIHLDGLKRDGQTHARRLVLVLDQNGEHRPLKYQRRR